MKTFYLKAIRTALLLAIEARGAVNPLCSKGERGKTLPTLEVPLKQSHRACRSPQRCLPWRRDTGPNYDGAWAKNYIAWNWTSWEEGA